MNYSACLFVLLLSPKMDYPHAHGPDNNAQPESSRASFGTQAAKASAMLLLRLSALSSAYGIAGCAPHCIGIKS